MKNSLQHYTVVLAVEGPLFIGSGQSIGKKEYLFDRRSRQVLIPDMAKLILFLQERQLTDAYESFMLKSRDDFSAWLWQQKIPLQQCYPWIAYALDSGDAVWEDRGKKEIAAFVKDPYGCPYVPGSSLKGALRTALLAADIRKDPQRFRQSRNKLLATPLTGKRRDLQRETEELEQQCFHTLARDKKDRRNAVNDILSGLRVGDSAPLSVGNLTLCQKIDVLPDGRQRRLPILRECLKPGTELRFPLTIDPVLCPVTPKELLRAATELVGLYESCFLRSFPMDDILGGGNLYLGGGSGFFSKTVLYPLLGKTDGLRRTSEVLSKQFRQHKHNQDLHRGVSPHTVKCTRYRGALYEMGACTMDIL